jgi:hypothetical protein
MDETRERLRAILADSIPLTPYAMPTVLDKILALRPQWISVEERLPEREQDVWATDGKQVEEGFRSTEDDNMQHWFDFHFPVTHWMVIEKPQPPMEG